MTDEVIVIERLTWSILKPAVVIQKLARSRVLAEHTLNHTVLTSVTADTGIRTETIHNPQHKATV